MRLYFFLSPDSLYLVTWMVRDSGLWILLILAISAAMSEYIASA